MRKNIHISYLKHIIIILFLLLFAQTTVYAANVTIRWTANTEPDLDHYKIYYKINSPGDPGDLSTYNGTGLTRGPSGFAVALNEDENDAADKFDFTVTGLTNGIIYYFVITAVDTESLESDGSDEISTGTGGNPAPVITTLNVNGTGGATAVYTNAETRQVSVRIAATDDNTVNQYLILDNDSDYNHGTFQDVPGGPGQNKDFTVSFTLNDSDGSRIIYAWVKDSMGTISSAASKSNVTLDRANPIATILYSTTEPTNQNVTATLQPGESVAVTNNEENTVYTFNDNGNFTFQFVDQAGNTGSATATVNNIDGNFPSGSIEINDGAVETENVTVILNLLATDSESGVSQMQFSNNNVDWSTPEAYNTIKSWVLNDGLGTKTVYIKYKDGAENWSIAYSDSIELVDNTFPGDVTAVSYSIENENLTLNWTNPATVDFKGTIIKYGVSAYPADHSQGVLFCDQQTDPGESDTHTGPIPEGTHYFSFFTYDQNENYSHTTHLTVIVSYSAGETYTKVFGDTFGADHQGTIQDTFININTDNNINSEDLNTYTWPVDQTANSIIMKIDLSAIPAGAQIQSAVLYVYMNGFGETGGDDLYDVSIHKIINHNPLLSACTGYTYDGTNSWTPNNSCYNSIPMAQADIAEAQDNKSLDKTIGYKSWNITGMVQNWIADQETNFGLVLNSDSTASSSSNRIFSSSEASDPNQRPKLEITYTYTASGSIPAPTGLVVVE